MATDKKRRERTRQEVKEAGGLRAWFNRQRRHRELKAAFKPSDRPARVLLRESEEYA